MTEITSDEQKKRLIQEALTKKETKVIDPLAQAENSRDLGGKVTDFGPSPRGHNYLINDPQTIREALVIQHRKFVEEKHPYTHLGPVLSDSGFKILQMPKLMHGKDPLLQTHQEVVWQTSTFTNSFLERYSPGQTIDLWPVLAKLNLRVMARSLFQFTLGEYTDMFFEASMAHEDFLTMARRGGKELRTDEEFLKKGREARRRQAEVAQKIFELRYNELYKDMPSMERRKQPLPEGLTFAQAMVRTFLNAYAGVATTLCWSAILLAQHPEIQESLRSQILKRWPREMDMEGLAEVPLLKAVIQESMRLYPAAWMMSRMCVEESTLGEQLIKEKDEVFICTYSLHRDPKLWKYANDFRPERFVGDELGGAEEFAFLPFGAGPHKCVGAGFAMSSLQLMLGTLLQSLRFETVPGVTLRPFPRVALRPEPGALVKVSPI
jgi:cytochrome P450